MPDCGVHKIKGHKPVEERPSWDEFFMELARATSKRSTCNRLHVGCVLVRDKVMVSGGYNGSVSGHPHCDDVGHDLEEGHCLRAIHAEQNAITLAAKIGSRVEGSTAYVTHYPCWYCFRMLLQAGVVRVVYECMYKLDIRVEDAAELSGIKFECFHIHART